jgi:hypothetical protein
LSGRQLPARSAAKPGSGSFVIFSGVAAAKIAVGTLGVASAANPARRTGSPDDIVQAVLFAMTSTFLTGQTAHRRRRTAHLPAASLGM